MAIIYITKDRERATGLTESSDYSIISGDGSTDTLELLSRKDNVDIIKNSGASVLVFKNNIQIEELCKKEGIKLLNPSAVLAEKIENKITQVEWLGELSSLLPSHTISETKNMKWKGESFILQWAHGHTGDGTLFIKNEGELDILKEKFPNRQARCTDFIKGPMFTLNIVVLGENILLGNISYQITGMLPFTENPFSTIGNDWALPHTILTEERIVDIENIANKIGNNMRSDGWLGLFGIDVIYEEEKDKIHLIEINARQTASTTYESKLQHNIRKISPQMSQDITIFEAHIKALTQTPIKSKIIIINDGAQILQRVTSTIRNIDEEKLMLEGYNTIKYPNTKNNSDLLRIQSARGIMENHNKFNDRGKSILKLILD